MIASRGACAGAQPDTTATKACLEWQHMAMALDFAVIGAQKGATTFLQHRLAAHPHIDLPRTESPELEDPTYGPDTASALAARLNLRQTGVRRGIKRPNYLGSPEVPARLARHAPGARLVVVLRDPVWRAVSAYRHYVISGLVELTTLDIAFRRLLTADKDDRFPRGNEILRWGRYGEHLERYHRYFAAEQVLVHLHEDIVSDAERVVATTFEFLEVDSTLAPGRSRGRQNAGPRSTLQLRFRRSRVRARRAHLARRAAGHRVAATLSWPYMAAMTGVDRYVVARVPGPLDQPSAELIATLRDYYRDDVRRTQDLLCRDLTMWT